MDKQSVRLPYPNLQLGMVAVTLSSLADPNNVDETNNKQDLKGVYISHEKNAKKVYYCFDVSRNNSIFRYVTIDSGHIVSTLKISQSLHL